MDIISTVFNKILFSSDQNILKQRNYT